MKGNSVAILYNECSYNGQSGGDIYWGNNGTLTLCSDGSYNMRIYVTAYYQDYWGNYIEYETPNVFSRNLSNLSYYTFYGDWLYSDGTAATDITTPTKNVVVTNDPSSLTDNELVKLLEDLILNLKLDYPDLSSIEGLLSAILSKLGTLDSDDDGALLSHINAAICSLATDSHADNLALITALAELKDALTEGAGEGSTTDIQPIIDELKELKKSLDYLCTINTLDFGVDLWQELTDQEKKFLNEYSTLITTLISKFGLNTIDNMLISLNSVILNTNAPAPLVVNMYGEDITVLSPETFAGDAGKYLALARTFVSVLLVYSFCMMMRKKIAGEAI